MTEPLKAPFPYFGGKRSIASLVWRHLGAPDNVVEPFFGSGAVLLSRPQPFGGVETVNDADHMVANFWRATQSDPEAVVGYADGPVNEVELHSRHRWLVLSDDAAAFRERMRADSDYFDAKVAGWWCWGLCCWIGGGWCRAPADVQRGANQPPQRHSGGGGVHGKGKVRIAAHNRGSHGKGVHAQGEEGLSEGSAGWKQMPLLRDGGKQGVRVNATLPEGRPQLADAYDVGRGVHASPPAGLSPGRRPKIDEGVHYGNGVHAGERLASGGTCAERRAWLLDWFGRLRDRLRNVRVCCGDWLRVCNSDSVTTRLGTTGIFLDPPYPKVRRDGSRSRASSLYATDGATKTPEQIRDEVLAYCIERGGRPGYRICVAGYETDGYGRLVEECGWKVVEWKSQGGYGNRSEVGKANRKRERLWFSPQCVFERTLFDAFEGPPP